MTPEEQTARTGYPGNGSHAHEVPDCEAGTKALKYLNGDGPERPGVFSRLDRIERLLGLGVLVISGPLWWVGWMMHEWIKKHGVE